VERRNASTSLAEVAMTSGGAGRSRIGPRRLTCLSVLMLGALAAGCHSLGFLHPRDKADEKVERPLSQGGKPGLPSRYGFRIAPYVFLSDFEIKREQPLFKELALLRDQVQKELLLPPGDAAVQVYLFETKERYELFMNKEYPDLPPRRAFFVAQARTMGGAEDLLVYTYWGKRIRQDLRHELTHALLHSVIKDVPLWLDEGLAEYFELPPENQGINTAHVRRLRDGIDSGGYQLSLARLEGLEKVEQMNPAEYREAWAWVHLMLRSRPEARTVLLSYLNELRGKRHPGPLAAKLVRVFPALEQQLLAHLTQIERDVDRARVASRPVTTNAPVRP
jgi:hypothetical protein